MIKDSNVKEGNWLFVRRGELPVIILMMSVAVIFLQRSEIQWSNVCWYKYVCLGVSLLGLAIRVITIGTANKNTSGRNTKVGQVADMVNTTGIYSLMRHPLYVGNFFMWFGLALYVGSVWFMIVFILLYFIYYERIMMAEEDFLYKKFGEPYKEWSERVNAVIPNFNRYIPAENTFSTRTVIRREYHGIFYLTLSFVLLSSLKRFVEKGSFMPDWFWIYFGAAILIYCVIVRILAKKTKVLNVEGRS